MTTPKVTITVGGVPVSELATAMFQGPLDELSGALYMTYLQATRDTKRIQWVVFPPAVKALNLTTPAEPGSILVLNRFQEFVGNRSKWFHKTTDTSSLLADFNNQAGYGFEFAGPIVVPLELDDYREVWAGNTPHKALRAVARSLKPYGLTVK